MNWEAIGAIGEIVGALAVVLTLLYLAREVMVSNRHSLLGAFQHTYDSLNRWCVAAYESPDVASIILRGRESLDSLTDVERFQFDHVHIHLINIIESHHYQVQQTAMDDRYREWAIRNLELIVQGYLGYPGTRELWSGFQEYIEPEARALIARNIGE